MTPYYRERLINEMRQIQSSRKKKFSKLDAFKKEIMILRQFSLSYIKISNWLYSKHGISISASQISRTYCTIWKNDPLLEIIRKEYANGKGSLSRIGKP
ncbi:hypothetical protein DZ860_16645 [Vibrio sinensis]|uniref:Uncharacterized protein n=1 Tax=Vibrio sinensis TaxID=2302434 RepID=A0A3A6Q9Q7_9VIBR|nr:hypothetical protein DZ860_16645 [Vibrio sinensis]